MTTNLANPTSRGILPTHSLDKNTHSNYGTGLLCFTQFCDTSGVPEVDWMPAAELLLASSAGLTSDKTLSNWLAGLHYWHPWHGADMLHHV
jgi:hypothetical protein